MIECHCGRQPNPSEAICEERLMTHSNCNVNSEGIPNSTPMTYNTKLFLIEWLKCYPYVSSYDGTRWNDRTAKWCTLSMPASEMMKDARQSSVDSIIWPKLKTICNKNNRKSVNGQAQRFIVFRTFISLALHNIHYPFHFIAENSEWKISRWPLFVSRKRTKNKWKSILILAGWKVDVDMATEPNALNAKWFHSIFIVIVFDSLGFFSSNFICRMENASVTFHYGFLGANHMCYCAPMRTQINYEQQSKLIAVISLGR